jgi:hypothetical protein
MNRKNFIKTLGIVTAGTIIAPSCEKLDFFSDIKQFDVKKGNNHYIGPQIPITMKDPIHFYAYIPDSQIHPPYNDEKCDGIWNKLYGAGSRVFAEKDENSACFVFRPLYEKNKIEIGQYTYNNGEIKKDCWTTEIDPNRYYEYEIRFRNGRAEYRFENTYVSGDPIAEKNFIGKFIQPYNGGPCGAYRDSYIVLKL